MTTQNRQKSNAQKKKWYILCKSFVNKIREIGLNVHNESQQINMLRIEQVSVRYNVNCKMHFYLLLIKLVFLCMHYLECLETVTPTYCNTICVVCWCETRGMFTCLFVLECSMHLADSISFSISVFL